MTVQWSDAAAKVHGGKALAYGAVVVAVAELYAAAGRQPHLPTGGMEVPRAERGDQVDRVEMGGALDIQGNL
ncbi:hypothetical protein D3C80_1916920 [compost metagenome]